MTVNHLTENLCHYVAPSYCTLIIFPCLIFHSVVKLAATLLWSTAKSQGQNHFCTQRMKTTRNLSQPVKRSGFVQLVCSTLSNKALKNSLNRIYIRTSFQLLLEDAWIIVEIIFTASMDEFLWKRVDLSEKKFLNGTLGPVLLRAGHSVKLARSNIVGPLFNEWVPSIRHLLYCHV